MRYKKLGTVFLAIVLTTGMILPVFASTTQEQIDQVQAQQENAKSSLNQSQANIDALENLKGDKEGYLTELNSQYEQLTNSLKKLEKQATEKGQELEELKADLKVAARQEAEQYAAMKKRIAYTYENGETSQLALLLSAETFTEFLNRAENAMQINKYDREMLKKYEEIKKEVATKKKVVEKEQASIQQLRDDSAAKREEIQQLEEATKNEIASYTAQISDEQSEAANLLELVNNQASKLDSLMAQAEQEEAAQRQAQATQENDVTSEEESSEDNSQETRDSSEDAEESSTPAQSAETSETNTSSQGGTLLGNFKLTAYCNCAKCCGTAGNLTASGTVPTAGRTVAMAGVPFGTKLLINGNVYTVEDLGTAYGHVDIFFNSHSDALAFGLQYADVYRMN